MLSTEHNKACVDRYAATGVLESERVPTGRPVDRFRGTCPKCGGNLYSDCFYRAVRGYEISWNCDDCTYTKVI